MRTTFLKCTLLAVLVGLSLLYSVPGLSATGDVFVLGVDSDFNRHLWRFALDGTYLGNIAPDNTFGGIAIPGDGYLYGIDSYTGDFTRMNFDGSNKTPIDILTDPTSVMGGWTRLAHSDGQGGILITPYGQTQEPRTLVRYATDGTLLARYTGMQHSGGIVADFIADLVFSTGSSAWDTGLYSFPWAGGTRTTLLSSTGGGYDMAIDRENEILFLGDDPSTVEMYDYAGNFLGHLNVGHESFALEYDSLTGYLFSGSFEFGTVSAVDMSGTLIHSYTTADMVHVATLAVWTVPEPATIGLLALAGLVLLKKFKA